MMLNWRATNTNRFTLAQGLWCSIGIHVLFVLVWISMALKTSKIELSEGAPAIRAVMIDPSVFAAPLRSAPNQRSDETPPKKEFEKRPRRYARLSQTSEAETKPQQKPIKKMMHRSLRANRVRQEVSAPNRADQVMGARQSDTTQFAQTPSPIYRIHPEYPMRAQALHINGKVVVQYDIGMDGRVTNIRIIEATPNSIFNQSVHSAMRKWKYEARPARDLIITIIFKQGAAVAMQNA